MPSVPEPVARYARSRSGGLKRRRAVATCVALVALGFALCACGGGGSADRPNAAQAQATAEKTATSSGSDGTLSVELVAIDDSGVSGKATLRDAGKNVRVVVRLSEPVAGHLPAHLHVGTCEVVPNLDVLNSLDDVVDGKSDTPLEFTTWADILEKDALSIHVHSPDLATIACGDVPHAS